jgi:hypothetical protein
VRTRQEDARVVEALATATATLRRWEHALDAVHAANVRVLVDGVAHDHDYDPNDDGAARAVS